MQPQKAGTSKGPGYINRQMDRINEALIERPGERVRILQRLKEADPQLYNEWLSRGALDMGPA